MRSVAGCSKTRIFFLETFFNREKKKKFEKRYCLNNELRLVSHGLFTFNRFLRNFQLWIFCNPVKQFRIFFRFTIENILMKNDAELNTKKLLAKFNKTKKIIFEIELKKSNEDV